MNYSNFTNLSCKNTDPTDHIISFLNLQEKKEVRLVNNYCKNLMNDKLQNIYHFPNEIFNCLLSFTDFPTYLNFRISKNLDKLVFKQKSVLEKVKNLCDSKLNQFEKKQSLLNKLVKIKDQINSLENNRCHEHQTLLSTNTDIYNVERTMDFDRVTGKRIKIFPTSESLPELQELQKEYSSLEQEFKTCYKNVEKDEPYLPHISGLKQKIEKR